MKTKVLLTIGAVLLAAVTINLNAGTGAAFLTKHSSANAVKAAPVTEFVTVTYKAPANTALLTPRAAGNAAKIVIADAASSNLKAAKCQLAGTPKSIEIAGNKARMACCNMTLAQCSTIGMCVK